MLKPILARQIPLDDTARFVVGRYWQTENAAATLKFQGQFRDFVAEALAKAIRAHRKLSLTIEFSRQREDGSTLVESRLNLASGISLPLDWKLERDQPGGAYYITDFALVGIDVRVMMRNMAGAVLSDGRSNLDDVIDLFRNAVATATAADAAPKDALETDPPGAP